MKQLNILSRRPLVWFSPNHMSDPLCKSILLSQPMLRRHPDPTCRTFPIQVKAPDSLALEHLPILFLLQCHHRSDEILPVTWLAFRFSFCNALKNPVQLSFSIRLTGRHHYPPSVASPTTALLGNTDLAIIKSTIHTLVRIFFRSSNSKKWLPFCNLRNFPVVLHFVECVQCFFEVLLPIDIPICNVM